MLQRKFTLSVSIVLFQSDRDLLRQTIDSLAHAICHATEADLLGNVSVTLVDNDGRKGDAVTTECGPGAAIHAVTTEYDPGVAIHAVTTATMWRRIAGQGNVGFGRGHNLVLLDNPILGDFHLVLNPDALLAVDALTRALEWMRDTPDCALVAPNARDTDDAPLFLAKRYPDALTLFLRAAAPQRLRTAFAQRLARYQLQDVVGTSGERQARDVTLASGCCMLLRREPLAATGGFDPAFFVYFEDYDLSLRIVHGGRWHIDYLPNVKLVHFGGHAARKSVAHIRMFAAGAIRFFNKHGWKLA